MNNKIFFLLFCFALFLHGLVIMAKTPLDADITVKELANGLGIRYWILKNDVQNPLDEYLYMDIYQDGQKIHAQKITRWTEIDSSRILVFCKWENNQYHLSILSNGKGLVGWKIKSDLFSPVIILYNPEAKLNTFLMKGGKSEVTADYSKTYNGEQGVMFSVRKEEPPKESRGSLKNVQTNETPSVKK